MTFLKTKEIIVALKNVAKARVSGCQEGSGASLQSHLPFLCLCVAYMYISLCLLHFSSLFCSFNCRFTVRKDFLFIFFLFLFLALLFLMQSLWQDLSAAREKALHRLT